MNEIGSSGVKEVEDKTLVGRFKAFRERYRVQTSATIAVLVILAFIAAELEESIQQYILTSGLLQYLTLMFVADLAASVYSVLHPPATRIMFNQDDSMARLIESLSKCRNQSVDLLEYAGFTTLPLIRAICREGLPMRLLVKHPETVEGHQRQRNITTLDTLYNSVFEDYKGTIEIRCYRLQYSLRGRRLGDEILELGWLTPDVKGKTAFGHGNPSLIVDLSKRNNEHLRIFFEKTFETLWNDEGTEDGHALLKRMNSSP